MQHLPQLRTLRLDEELPAPALPEGLKCSGLVLRCQPSLMPTHRGKLQYDPDQTHR